MALPLWLDPALAPHRPRPALDRSVEADLVVLGLGMTGTACALAAAERGLRVVALDAGEVACGASGRNAGFLLAGPEAHYAATVRARGRSLAREIWRLNRTNRDDVVRLAESLGLECDLRRTGSLVAAVSEAEAEELRESHRMMREDGLPGALLGGKEADALAGAEGFVAGLHVPDDAELHPARFVRGLADAAEGAGASLHERTRVVALRRVGAGWAATTEGGARVAARAVACGLNAYAPGVLDFARERVFPVRGQVLATAPLAKDPVALPVYADHGYLYARSWRGRAVVGGLRHRARAREVGVEDRLDEELQRDLETELRLRWPAAGAPEVTHRWSGAMGFSRDGLPWIGEAEPGLLVAMGYTGHGWGYGVAAGGWLADLAAGRSAAIPPWLDARRPLVAERTAW